ncbi:MAG TPA: HNH endonuclease [Gemmatimonadales bacterium]
MPTCIYCRQSKGPFTREHVIQDGFGRFKNALVIHDAVCHECNQEFSRTIDLALTRSSAEGFERYRFGVKEPAEIAKFKYSSLTLRVRDPGDFHGAQFIQRADPTGKKLVSHVVPGIAVRRKDGEGFLHFTEAQVRDGSWRQNTDVDWRRGIKVYGGGAKGDEIRAVLEAQGVAPSAWRPLKPPESGVVTVEQEFEFTSEMQRAVAKIGFNYLTHCEDVEYALLEAFDPIRRYIRYGEKPSSSLPPVISLEGLPFDKITAAKEVLKDGPKRPVIHFVNIGTNVYRNIASAITLFGFMTHRVMLAEAFKGPMPEQRAHLYNVKMKEVFELRGHA